MVISRSNNKNENNNNTDNDDNDGDNNYNFATIFFGFMRNRGEVGKSIDRHYHELFHTGYVDDRIIGVRPPFRPSKFRQVESRRSARA